MNYSFHPEAEIEFTKAIDYYEDHQRELGFDFSIEVNKTIHRIMANPESWTLVSRSIGRKFNVSSNPWLLCSWCFY